MAKQQRGSSYLLQRLKKEAPAIYRDYQAKKTYKTVRQAAIAAGLRKPTCQLNLLKNAWDKADPAQRADFLAWIGASSPTTPSGSAIVDGDRRLLPAAASRVEYIIAKRRMKPGEVMKEMGLKPLDQSLAMALRRSTKLRSDLVIRLEGWLDRNKHV